MVLGFFREEHAHDAEVSAVVLNQYLKEFFFFGCPEFGFVLVVEAGSTGERVGVRWFFFAGFGFLSEERSTVNSIWSIREQRVGQRVL